MGAKCYSVSLAPYYTYDHFGSAVAIDGDTMVVGANRDDDKSANSGSAYVFVRSGSTWTQQQKLTASDGYLDDNFGNSVAISGDTIVVGAERQGYNELGAAYVFVRSGTTWTQQQKLAPTLGFNPRFGRSVSIDGDNIAVGMPHDIHGNPPTFFGSAYVFVRGGATWTQQQKITSSLPTLLSPNPPKDTDGRREESGRGVRELQGK